MRDNVTGLIWEKKPKGDGKIGNQGLHDADDTYTWYSTDASNNGGSVGYPRGDTCFHYNSAKSGTWCNTQAFVKRVNAEGWCGAKNWRMPTVQELERLVDFSISDPNSSIDTKHFPDAVGDWYWSSSPDASDTTNAWMATFYDGHSSSYHRSNFYAVLLVRGGR